MYTKQDSVVALVRRSATLSLGVVARSKVSTATWCRRRQYLINLYTQPFCTSNLQYRSIYVCRAIANYSTGCACGRFIFPTSDGRVLQHQIQHIVYVLGWTIWSVCIIDWPKCRSSNITRSLWSVCLFVVADNFSVVCSSSRTVLMQITFSILCS